MNKTDKACKFVQYIIRCIQNPGDKAALRRADNAATEYQSWEYLAPFINLEYSLERLPYVLIAAAIAKEEIKHDGTAGIGEAIAKSCENGDQAQAKLRRLLACKDIEETCQVLRPLLSFIRSKQLTSLCYSRLLNDLLYFHDSKTKWARNFYSHNVDKEES